MNEMSDLRRRIAGLEQLENAQKLTIEILRASENKYRVLLENSA